MTPTEKAYSKEVGKLFYSKNRNSLVFVTGIKKRIYSSRWEYDIEYLDASIGIKTMKCKRMGELIRMGQWISAADLIAMQPSVSSEK